MLLTSSNRSTVFSSSPKIQNITREDIATKLRGIKTINSNTDIDKVFTLILKEFINEEDVVLKLLKLLVEKRSSHFVSF